MRKILLCVLSTLLFVPNVYAEYEHIDVKLKWTHAFQFAGFYMALEKGFYQSNGLDVKLIEGGADKSPVDKVLEQEATYGVASTGALIEHSKGKPIQAIGAIFQYSPLALMVKEDSGIQTFADLRNKRIMLQQGYLNVGIIAALQKAGLTEKDFVRQGISYNISDLIEDRTDAYAIYATNQPYKLDVQGILYRIFEPKEYGVEFYGDILITSSEEVNVHPERVRAFMGATSQGWQYAFQHIQETIDVILTKYNTTGLTRSMLEFEAQTSAKYILADVVEPGYMNLFRWKGIADIYEKQGFLPENYDVESFVYLPKRGFQAFVETHLWQILLLLMVFVTLFFAAIVLVLRQMVARKTQALHASEQSAKNLLDMLDVGIVVHKNGCPLYANPYIIECFQLDASTSIYEKDVMQYIHPDDRKAAMQRLQGVESYGQGYARVPIRYIGEQGRLIDAEVGSMPFIFEGEAAILTTIHDVTVRNQRLVADAKVQKHLEQTQRLESLGVMAGGVAHDFNNLLAVILGHADIALYDMKKNPDAVSNSLKHIIQASESAASLCQQMLAYSGKGKFIIEPIQLSKLVKNMLNLIDVVMGKNTQVTYQIDDVAMVQGDGSQLQQVVMNLLTNASEAIEHEHGVIQLRVTDVHVDSDYLESCHHDSALPGVYVCIEVSDNGCGMSLAVKDKIFEPFFTTKFTGRGLGMSAILGITLGHKGAIHVESQEGRGTSIRVLFPSSVSSSDEDDSQAPKQNLEDVSLSGTVLLVDDEEQVLKMASRMLEGLGMKVITATNGQEAVALYQQNMDDIDIVMLDLTMPVMNGNDAYIALRDLNPNVKVVMCSGYTEEKIKQEYGQLSHLAFVHKPYLRSSVKSAVITLMT